MPKMKADYREKKRNEILDAALVLCMKKPMHEVSMRDIISAVGFSQGNIYRYFSNLDEVLIALINREAIEFDVKTAVDEAIASAQPPEIILAEIMEIWNKAILSNYLGVGKILFELVALYANDKERLLRLVTDNTATRNQAYLQEKFFAYITQKVSEGYFNPVLPLEDILNYFIASIDGIIRNLILSTHYNVMPVALEKDKLLKSLTTAFILLLGGKTND